MSIFGGDTGVSYEQLRRRREIADAMRKDAMGSTPRNVGEGLNAITSALIGRYQQRQFDKGAEAFRKQRGDNDPLVQALMMGTTAPITKAVNSGNIPAYARGTNFHPGGMALVGEEGPELVNLPKGAKVLPTEVAQSFFGPQGEMMPQQPSGMGTQVAPEPWMNRLNTLQFRIPELREKMEAYPDEAPMIAPELEQMERERDQILQRYQPQGFETAQAGMPNDPEAPPLGVGIMPYSQIGGSSGRVGAPRQGGGGDVAPVGGFGVPEMRGVTPPQSRPWDSGSFRQSRFDDANAYQVADAGTVMNDAGPQLSFGAMDMGGDAVSVRGLTGEEVNFRAAASRLSNIDAMLQESPELLDSLTFQGDMRRRFIGLKDKFGADLTGEQEEFLTNSTVFRQNILRNINRTIQEVTGAQMGEEEAKRIRAEMPDVDAGPVEFKAKLAAAMDMIRMDIARLNMWQKSGRAGKPAEITDEELRQTLRQAGQQYYQQAISQGMSASDARLEAARLLSEEYGI